MFILPHSATHFTLTLYYLSIYISPSYLLQPSLSHATNMSQTFMASISSFSSTPTLLNPERLDLESIRILVLSVNEHILRFLQDPDTRKSLQLRCISKLRIQKQEFFEFSEHSVVSNLYWGIESVEAAIQAKWPEERTCRLKSSERMLQVPALLEEHGCTGGIQNRYLVCCAYFYLSLVRKLQMDEWQVTLHFLQAMLVYPRLVRMELMPELWRSVFLCQTSGCKGFLSESAVDSCTEEIDEMSKHIARRYKDWLMYYQIMLYGETSNRDWGSRIAPLLDEESRSLTTSTSTDYLDSVVGHGNIWPKFQEGEKVHPLDFQDSIIDEIEEDTDKVCVGFSKPKSTRLQDDGEGLIKKLGETYDRDATKDLQMKCLQDILQESQSDTPISAYSCNGSTDGSDLEAKMASKEIVSRISTVEADRAQSEIRHRKRQTTCISSPERTQLTSQEATPYPVEKDGYEMNTSYFFSSRYLSSTVSDIKLPRLDRSDIDQSTICNRHVEGTPLRESEPHTFSLFDHISSRSLKNCTVNHTNHWGSSARKRQDSISRMNLSDTRSGNEKDLEIQVMEVFKKAVSTLRFTEKVGKCEDVIGEVSIMWEVLNNKTEERCSLLKDEILDQLLNAISTSQEESVIRASVSVLTTLISKNKTVVEDIKRKGLRLCDLATALRRNVHEAAILIYLINPTPTEVKSLELLPALLEVVCNSKTEVPISLRLTPLAASLMMIEVLVTAFDYTTNNMHLAAISSPAVLSQLSNATRNKNMEEIISLASILIRCMEFDGQCKRFLSQFTPMDTFVCLLRSKEKRANITALQFFHEILRMPRSSAINLLHQIRKPDSINIMHTLMSCIQNLESEHRVLASNLLFQLDVLEDSSDISIFRDKAMEILLEAVASQENSAAQILSASIISNFGGTYSWTGESYTAAWLVQKAGLTSPHHKNMQRSIDWSDQSLQDGRVDAWCSRVARSIIKIGSPVFRVLEKGLQSKIKSVSRDCLIATAWIGCEMAKMGPSNLRYSACEILLSGIEQFLHPGMELEERLLACLSVYKYASGKGMQKLLHFSEGVRESLRRLSSITWMAEELTKVTDYFLPTKSRVSCVHTQIIEAGHNCGVAASALIYYKGQLCSGHSDGTIKVWDIRGQTAVLVWNVKEHKKAVTCFTLSEPGDSLLSGSTDKTIRVWQMVRRRLECLEVIETKEPVHKLESHNQLIFAITQTRGVKVFNASRTVKCICKSKHVKCITIVQGKLYLGCTDSSIQEVDIRNDREQEIQAPTKSWRMQNKPINSVLAYKEWLYSASVIIEGSTFKEWRRRNEPQMSISIGKGTHVQAMGVVEDFIYLNCSSSPSTIEIWLRGTQRKVGRLSAGSKITSLLTANDIVLCGTETGLIKGWIPL